MKKEVIGAICLALAASLWGGVYVVSKYILELVPPMTYFFVCVTNSTCKLVVTVSTVWIHNDQNYVG